jgi:N-acetylmuramoyl-L-alanine amidase
VSGVLASPNHDARPDCVPIDLLVLHYTGMPTAQAALARLTDEEAKVSCHWFVDEDGTTTQLVAEDRRAWHAGVSFWRGHENLNGRSIGVEIVNPGHEHGYRVFPEAQVAAVVALSQGILARHHAIKPRNVVAHSDIAPERKQDPGELFPWSLLAEAGIGLWPGPAPEAAATLPSLAPGDDSQAVQALRDGFARIGYRVARTGAYDAALAAVVTAFQRHWAPHRTDGLADAETRWRVGRVAGLAQGLVARPPASGL